MSNGLNHEANDTGSLYGTTKSGATGGWINAVAGVSGQSTLSRKSGREIIDKANQIFHNFDLATSAKHTERSNDARILSRDLLKKRNLLLTLLVSCIITNDTE